ncbi:TrbI/VirB10 family protein [Pseudomonas sp. Marseille-Q5115]|uniref:TrbI/VirB10 family protein n=1 Tax=Pseudomonas sp. Marseille-Q5115 TaxID=2866593 RepID=UPI001CE44B4C|nr:TrbI/VirB10 family protein [Pseudomonas sp. Marseille-Q5115]
MQNNDDTQAPDHSPELDRISPAEPNGTAEATPGAASTQARGAFDVRTKRKAVATDKKRLYLGIGAIVVVFLVVVIGGWSMLISKMKQGSTKVDETHVKRDATLDVDQGDDDSMRQAKMAKLRAEAAEEEHKARAERERQAREQQAKANPEQPLQAPASQAAPGASNKTQPPVITARQRKLDPAMFVQSDDGPANGAVGSSQPSQGGEQSPRPPSLLADSQAGLGGPLGGDASSRTRGSLGDLGGTGFASAKAYLAPPRKYLVTHNTYTRCALYTEIISTHPGMVDCRLTEPLYSADGSTVIADAGDKLTGEQRVQVGRGQSSVFTTWTEIETQSGVRAQINSLGAGPLGASGTEAWIDHHYLQRYGGAVMLSFIQDALQAAANSTQQSSSGYTVNNSEQNVESMANKALDSTINIPDTAHVLPGTVITVIVARDIDFSPVFENR